MPPKSLSRPLKVTPVKASEATVVDVTLAILKATYPSFEFSREANFQTEVMLAKASKHKTGAKGRPDIIGVLAPDTDIETTADVVIFVEVKKLVSNHGSFPGDNPVTQAIAGVTHYMEKAWEHRRSQGPSIVGMAVSGLADGVPEEVSVFGIAACNSSGVGDPVIRNLGFTVIPEEERLLELLFSFRGWPGAAILPKSNGHVALLPSVAISRMKVSYGVNRNLRPSHVEEIFEYLSNLRDQGDDVFVPGIIIMGIVAGTYYILDGQHRYEALKKANNEGWAFSFLIQLIAVKAKTDLREIYISHYLALEATAGEAALESEPFEYTLAANVIEGVISNLPKSPTKIFGRSQTCPFVKTVAAVERLGAYFNENPDQAAKGQDFLIKKILGLNAAMKADPPGVSPNGVEYSARTMAIAARAGCYLGLVRPESWFE
jgi:hypothetical protein